MKILVLLFLVCASQAAPNAKRCNSDEECDEETECCVERSVFFKGKCLPLPQEGEYCIPREVMKMIGDNGHRPGCPCVSGFECVPEKIEDVDGTITYLNTKCHPSTS